MGWNVVTTLEPRVRLSDRSAPNVFVERTTPTGVGQIPGRRPSLTKFRKLQILAGKFTSVLGINQFMQMFKAGIAAPTSAPTLASGGAGGLTGAMIGYVTFAHFYGSTLIHESSLGPASNTFNASSNDIDWTGIQASSPDTRVTHVRLYRSVDGADPRLVTTLAIGTTTFSGDNTATASLGQVGSDSNGVPPYARFVETYHDRVWYTGDPDNPSYVWYSEINVPEGVDTLNFIPLRDGEAVTGIKRRGDQLVVFGRRCMYDIQGYDEADFNMRKLTPSIGTTSHFAIVNIDERLFFPAEDGIWVYDGGAPVYLTDDLRNYWRADYESDVDAFNNLVASESKKTHVYRLLRHKNTSPQSFYYIGHYLGIEQGKPVRWVFDVRARNDSTVGLMDVGGGEYAAVTGSCDGFLRKEDVDSNADDDGDSYAKKAVLEWRAEIAGPDIRFGSLRGLSLKALTMNLITTGAWTLKLYGGEENASDSTVLQTISVATQPTRNNWPFRPVGVHGKALVARFEQSSPLALSVRGYDMQVAPGPGRKF